MIPMSAVTINWTGKQLTGEQQIVIHDAALDFDGHGEDERLIFEHPLCDGMIECKGRMTHGMYRGTRFIATLDGTDGTPRTYEFLLTDYYTKEQRGKTKIVWKHVPAENSVEFIEAGVIKKTRTMSARRSRAN